MSEGLAVGAVWEKRSLVSPFCSLASGPESASLSYPRCFGCAHVLSGAAVHEVKVYRARV